MKNIISKLISIFSLILIAAAVFILLTVVMTPAGSVPSIGGYSMLRVLTGSMEPSIPTDSIIFIRKTAAAELQAGDVISFYSPDPALHGAVNTHRIVDIDAGSGALLFQTRGDANHVPDEYPVSEGALIGKVVFVSSGVGLFIRLLSNPVVFFPLILLPMAAILISNLIHVVKSTRTILKQEEEAAIREALEAYRREHPAGQNNSAKEQNVQSGQQNHP